jgi:membrane protein
MSSRNGVIDTATATWERVRSHNVPVAAAGIAFLVLVATVPGLVALVSVYGMVADPADIEAQVSDLGSSVPEEVKDLLAAQLADVTAASGSGLTLGLAIGSALALVSASGSMRHLINTLNVAEGIRESRGFVHLRVVALGFTAGALAVLAAAIYLIAILPAAVAATDMGDTGRWLIGFARFPLLALVFGFGITLLYRYGPDRSSGRSFERFVPGAAVATLGWVAASALFSLYTANFGRYNETYGALGAVVVVLLWLQLSAFLVIIGAELNAVLRRRKR